MDHIDNLKKAFSMPWKYKYLIVFGLVVAICGGTNTFGPTLNVDSTMFEDEPNLESQYQEPLEIVPYSNILGAFDQIANSYPGNGNVGDLDQLDSYEFLDIDDEFSTQLRVFILVLSCIVFLFLIFLFIIAGYFRNRALGGLISSIDSILDDQQSSFKIGWQKGKDYWLRLFGLELLVLFVLTIFIVPLIIIVIFMPLIFLLICCMIPVLIALAIIVNLIITFARIYIVLRNESITSAFSDAYDFINNNRKDIFTAWIIFSAVVFIIAFLLTALSIIFTLPIIALSVTSETSQAVLIIVFLLVTLILFIITLPISAYVVSASNAYYIILFKNLSSELLDLKIKNKTNNNNINDLPEVETV